MIFLPDRRRQVLFTIETGHGVAGRLACKRSVKETTVATFSLRSRCRINRSAISAEQLLGRLIGKLDRSDFHCHGHVVLQFDVGALGSRTRSQPCSGGDGRQGHEKLLFDLQVTGVVVPKHEILVRPAQEGAHVTKVLVQPGDAVISGQVLARLKPPSKSTSAGSDIAVTAPEAGIVYSSSAVIGQTATAAGEPLFRIAQGGVMELSAETPVNTMPRLAVNQIAKVEVIGVGKELSGKVRFISTVPQLGEVRLLLDADRTLRVGAFGRGEIEIEQRCGPAIPLSAVLYARGGAVVQVVRDDQSRRDGSTSAA